MSADALFDLLTDFGSRPLRPQAPGPASQPPAAPVPAVDAEALLAERVAEATAEIETRLATAHREELEAERKANAEEAETFMASLGKDIGATVADHMQALEKRLGEMVGSQVARILGSVMSDDLQRRSLDSLARVIGETLGDDETMRIRVSGPALLFEALREAMGARASNLDFSEVSGFDLTVTVDDTVLETRMSEWSHALSEILA
jgi:hypothetical protein